ncbi:discoidin domain-containing protein [Dactylosporangium vinaceum]|uniref:Discoidin domain-containing protein n=1 Tax=Dactylosporangium vinaceum TaxID=53362 RepID=A0ABV5MRI1_9ACTN|nr:discoidin domain-containing protein [Dactylosporangium vinaceum]UAC00431.1 discoidin domain-containing protein [Dactylosporangium vinaceum]
MTSRLRLLWGALVLSAAAAITVAVIPPAHAADAVLSQNRPVTASSQESAGTPAAAGVDGNTGTRWSSAFAPTQWFQVDLGTAATVSRVDIAWENAYAKAFSIQFSSDGSAYTQVYATTTGPGGRQSITANGTARYVRINLTTRALAAYGYSFWEFQVFGAAGPATGRAINGLTLVNNASRKPILGPGPLTDGTVVDLTRLANRNLSVRADLAAGAAPASVAFTMTGAKGSSYTRTETQQPYFLCNDYADCPLLATPDTYTLTAQAYASTGAQLGAAYTVHFTVTGTATAQSPVDVLFVGNSLIGTATAATGEDTPALVRHLASAAGRTVNVTEVIHFGNTLQQTWDGGEVAAALSGAKQYDFIVLQEYSTLVATNPAQATNTLVNTYAPTFARSLKPGGRVVLFKNWALVDPAPFATRAAETAAIDTGYAALSASLGAANLVAPISDEFETIIAANGTSYLIVADGKHPNDTAIYLDAATLYGILLRESPRSLPDLYLTTAVASNMRATAAAAIGY